MGRPKELSSCAICGDDTPAITRIEYLEQWVPVCNKHRSRIYRHGDKDLVRWFWVEEKNLKTIVGLVYGQGLSYRKASEQFGPGDGTHLTKTFRRWRVQLLDQYERERMTQEQLAEYWDLDKGVIREQIAKAREERKKGKH